MKTGEPADIVYDYIKNQIVQGHLSRHRIVEEDLVRETASGPGCSALMQLAMTFHPAAAQPKRRWQPSATDLRQVMEAGLCGGGAWAAVHRRSDESVLQMEELQKSSRI